MTVNLVIWRWTEAYDNSSKRRRLNTKFDDVYDGLIAGDEPHPGQAEFDQGAFIEDLTSVIGPQAPEGDWLAECYERSVVINMVNVAAVDLITRARPVARRNGLNTAARF